MLNNAEFVICELKEGFHMYGALEKFTQKLLKGSLSLENRLLFLLLLGPCALLVAAAFAFFEPIANPFIFVFVALGFILSYQWGMKGFVIGASAFLFFVCQIHFFQFWQIFYAATVCVSLLITALATEEAKSMIVPIHFEVRALEKMLDEERKASLKKEEMLLQEIASQKREISQLPQLPVDGQDLARQSFLPEAEHEIYHQYKQLRIQFEEKSEVLNQTRKQLFQTENELLALQREKAEKELEDAFEYLSWQKTVLELQSEKDAMEMKLACLEDIVTQLEKKA